MTTEGAAILVVDDNEENRNVLSRRLQRDGQRVVMAENGRQALEILRQRPFDLVLLDIMMPELNGYQVLEQMKADPELRHVPVIVISAVSEIESIVRCIELGADDYLPKPFNRVLLQARVGNSLEKKRLHDQEQAYLQALEAANQTKNRFISAIAHEIRNFVTPVSGYLELLRGGLVGTVSEEQARFLQVIWSNVQSIRALLVDLADIPRLETGQLQLNPQATSVGDAISEVASAMWGRTSTKSQLLQVKVPTDLPLVWADRTRLAQVLTNLVSNAHKYTPDQGEIRIQAERMATSDDTGSMSEVVHVSVQDTGIGIAPEEQGKIFQEFFRSADEQAREAPGVGLGLSITKRLVEMQGGRIWFESEFRKGTTFHFTVPLAQAGAVGSAQEAHR